MADTDVPKTLPPGTTDTTSTTLLTPINIILISILLYLVYLRLRPQAPQTLPKAPAPTVFRTFTPPTLLPYNGLNGKPIYFAVRGRVFDVSTGASFYGPGGPYANFAGRDASRGLACGSFDEDMLTKDLTGPLDDLKGLGAEEMEALRGWEERFEEKYLVVGKIVAVGSEEAIKAEKLEKELGLNPL
ncbi:cytochrome b5 [Pseudovirgaria hyperparasitica]|uniref:Cytochrome b5 n=1 Tax=Pseudovirgaria hyperparasitica TaxID=470096 RepID=A0A6A6WH59_9PEZI|nr:cytochrome b5 [Pseudovirgaria hyperparasitica]KAF2761425.1 cytochrome b5 [Pseudovirgaria hyperparasitica]